MKSSPPETCPKPRDTTPGPPPDKPPSDRADHHCHCVPMPAPPPSSVTAFTPLRIISSLHWSPPEAETYSKEGSRSYSILTLQFLAYSRPSVGIRWVDE